MAIHVDVDTFVRAETDRMFHDLQELAGSVNTFGHHRAPAPIDQQTVIRENRDTLYSFAVVDVSHGATLTLPEHDVRYVSAMVVDEDHYVGQIFHRGGAHRLEAKDYPTDYVVIAVRILVNPTDAADIAEVVALQDQLELEAGSAEPFVAPEYDTTTLDATRRGLLELAAGLSDFDRMFGTKEQVDPVRHLIGTAAGWGGLPSSEATYFGIFPSVDGNQQMTLRDVPVDAFWSVSVYNRAGYFQVNDRDTYTVNSLTAVPDPDGAVTVRFGVFPAGTPNAIPTPDGWNLVIRCYLPRAAVLDGTWQPPALEPAD